MAMEMMSYEELWNENKKLKEQNNTLIRTIESLESNFQNTLECIAILDKNFHFIRVNNNYAKTNGQTPEFFIGKNHFELFPSEEAEQIFKGVLQTKKPFSISARPFSPPNKPGEVQYWDWKLCPLLDDQNEVDLLILYLLDITETKLLRDEMERLDRLNIIGQVAAGLAHEIRNPMTTVRGFLQLLSKQKPDEEALDYFQIMIDEMDRANSIITEFLTFAKNKPVNVEEKNLNHTLESIDPLLQADAIKNNKVIVLQKGDIPKIKYDEKEIRQLIFNLVRNGLEAMPPKGTLGMKTYQEKNHVVLEIQDEGPGIPIEILDKVWLPFFTTKDQGTGLGLSICYRIAQRHRAEMEIKSHPDGTTFYVRFPISRSKVSY